MRWKFQLSALLQWLLFSQLDSSSLKWDTSSPKLMSDSYSPYELCVLQLTPDSYDVKYYIFDQPVCKHLIDSFLEQLPKRCWLGGLHQPHDEGLCIGNKMKGDVNKNRKCSNVSDKKGLWKSWRAASATANTNRSDFNDLVGEKHGDCQVKFQKHPGYVAAVLQGAIDSSFEIIAFAGDSMSVQTIQRMTCAVLRANMTVQQFGIFNVRPAGASAIITDDLVQRHFQSCQPVMGLTRTEGSNDVILSQDTSTRKNIAEKEKRLLEKKTPVTTISLLAYKYFNGFGKSDFKQNKQNSIPEIEAKCGLPGRNMTCRREIASAHIYKLAMSDFRKGKKWENTLHFLLLPVALKYNWEFKPLARALREISEEIYTEQSRIVVLSPYSQHFASHPQGLYENYTAVKMSDDLICQPHRNPYLLNMRHIDAITFESAMDGEYPMWRERIGFFQGFPKISSPWFDLHPESKSYGWPVDCTHYTFQPNMFEEIWRSLADYIGQDHKWKIKKNTSD